MIPRTVGSVRGREPGKWRAAHASSGFAEDAEGGRLTRDGRLPKRHGRRGLCLVNLLHEPTGGQLILLQCPLVCLPADSSGSSRNNPRGCAQPREVIIMSTLFRTALPECLWIPPWWHTQRLRYRSKEELGPGGIDTDMTASLASCTPASGPA